MKKILSLALLAMMAMGAQAEEKKDSAASTKPVFTIVKEIHITSIKDQNRSGTCWNYSTLSYFEAEILKATGKTYDLCESFVETSAVRGTASSSAPPRMRRLAPSTSL